MYYKNVLVLTDNYLQFERIYEYLVANSFFDSKFTFACSFGSEKIFAYSAKAIFPINIKLDYSNLIGVHDLIISLHCKQLFPKALVERIKCINIHPGYTPINRGWFPQVFAIIKDIQVGATIHEIDEMLDHGDIIDQIIVENYSWDTSLTLYNRILESEMDLIRKNLISILNNNYKTIKPNSEGNIFLKKDFNNLCKIDLNEQVDYRTVINKLRAMTHGNYKNAYFIDEKTGKKVFVSIQLQVED